MQLTGHNPELPKHDEGTSNSMRSHLGRIDRDCGILCTDADAHNKSCREKSLPGLCEGGTNWRGSKTASSDENLASPAKVVVEWIDNEGTYETGSQEDDGIDDSHDPFISPFTINAKILREGQVGAVGSRLIPSLRGGSDGTQRDRVPEHERAVPLMVPLVCKRVALLVIDLAEHLESLGVPRDEGGAAEQTGVLGHAMRLGESLGIGHGLLRGAAL